MNNENMKTMTHRGITGTIERDEDGWFGGELLNIHGDAIYGGKDMAELETKFRKTVDFYIECELEEGRDPYNPPPAAKPLKSAQG